MTTSSITNYLDLFYPHVLQEMQTKMSAIPYSLDKVKKVFVLVDSYTTDHWEKRIILLASCLVLFSPETMFANCMVRRGVVPCIADLVGVTSQAISKQVDQARHYYLRTEWCRGGVDKIVKEVKG